MEFILGSELKDLVTGYKGIATARVQYINGCVQYALFGRVDDKNGIPPAEYFDVQRLELIGLGLKLKSRETGGPQRDQPKA